MTMKPLKLFTYAAAAALLLILPGAGEAANQPAQPKAGAGGSDYVAAEVVKKAYGSGSAQAFVFRPAGDSAEPRPVVVFLHAPGAVSPKFYGAWIEHLARKGLIVVYPRYELDAGRTRFSDMTGEAAKGLKEALAGLEAESGVRADLGKVAIVGHSGGALIAANLAAMAAAEGLPKARLVFAVMPARPSSEPGRGTPLADLSTLDAATVLVTMVGDRDAVAGESGARQVIRAAGTLPIERRLIVKLGSDNHGQPPMVAGHYAASAPNEAYDFPAIPGAAEQPTAAAAGAPPRDREAREQARKDAAEQWRTNYVLRQSLPNFEAQETDAMDWLGFWRTFDIVRDTVFAGGDAMALRRNTKLYDMSLWSDGWPVRRLNVESPKAEAVKPAGEPAAEETAPAREEKPAPRRPRRS